jgi:hypothetical protein
MAGEEKLKATGDDNLVSAQPTDWLFWLIVAAGIVSLLLLFAVVIFDEPATSPVARYAETLSA